MIHIVMGLPGVGKTVAAKYLTRKLSGIRINTDDLHGRLYPVKEYVNGDFPPDRLEQIYNTIGVLAFYLQKANPSKHYFFEGSFRYKKQREVVINQVADKRQPKILLIEVNDEGEIKKRITKRHRQGAPSTYEVYLEVKSGFEKPEKKVITIDNSGSLRDLHKKLDNYISKVAF